MKPPKVTLEVFKDWWARRVDKPIPKSVPDKDLKRALDLANARAQKLHDAKEARKAQQKTKEKKETTNKKSDNK